MREEGKGCIFKRERVAWSRQIEIPHPTTFTFTVSEDGENRILIAVNHKVIDVTRGRHLYGPGGPYDLYAGRDVSRGLATFTVDSSVVRETYDDLRCGMFTH